MASRWPNRNGNNNAILPLALELYYDCKMHTNNEWDSDNKEGVKQFFYNKKENTEDEYEYATTGTIKTIKEVGQGEAVIPYRGKVMQEESIFNWATKIHIPCNIQYKTLIHLSAAMLDLSAPNARNKYRNLHVVTKEKKMRTL
jgi:hypothetical protein